MANVYRSEVILKGEKSKISNFIKNTFSIEDERQYLDFEKLLPLNGKHALDVWSCDSERFNFEVARSEDQCFAFRFDFSGDLPSLAISQIMNVKRGLAEIIIRSCCERLSIAVHMIGNRDLRTMISDRKSRSPLSKKLSNIFAMLSGSILKSRVLWIRDSSMQGGLYYENFIL